MAATSCRLLLTDGWIPAACRLPALPPAHCLRHTAPLPQCPWPMAHCPWPTTTAPRPTAPLPTAALMLLTGCCFYCSDVSPPPAL